MYYLVYKLKTSNIMWVIKIEEELDLLLQNHEYIYEEDIEEYFIFQKYWNINRNEIKNFKRFQNFNYTRNYILLYELK